jgi:hypothetical protein
VPVWILVPLIFLAVHRITRLIIEDTFPPIGVPRDRVVNWWDPDDDWSYKHPNARPHWGAVGRSLAYLFRCPWCMSMWVGGALIYGLTFWTSVPLPVLVWLGASTVTGLLATYEDAASKQ